MDFSLSQERQMLTDSMRRLLNDKLDAGTREAAWASEAGYSSDLWASIAELGSIGALFPESTGGFGGTAWDVATVFEQVGRSLVPGPFLGTLMAGSVLARSDATTLLEKLICGDLMVTCHVVGILGTDPVLELTHSEHEARLTGTFENVEYATAAEMCVVLMPSAEPAQVVLLDLSQEACKRCSYPMIDIGSGADIHLKEARAEVLSLDTEDIEAVLAVGILACCWEAVGLMAVIFDQTLDYLRTRQQFGTSIGKFQALQHRMADSAIDIEQARSSAMNAAASFSCSAKERDRLCSAAKHTVGSIGKRVAEEAIQLHGGIGMTWELPLSHYAKRLIMLNHILGDDDFHLQRYVELSSRS